MTSYKAEWVDSNDNQEFILITMERPFFQKRNVQALLLNKKITYTNS